jgi:hypothetical protein
VWLKLGCNQIKHSRLAVRGSRFARTETGLFKGLLPDRNCLHFPEIYEEAEIVREHDSETDLI